MIIIRKINFLLIFILFFTFTFSFSCARKSPPIATVGGEPIAKADLDQAMEEFGKEVPLPSKPEELEILKKDLLDQLIQDRIFLQAARKEKIALPDSESEEAIKKAKADYSDQEFSEMLKT